MNTILTEVLDNINNKTVDRLNFDMDHEKVTFNLNTKESALAEIAFEGVLSFFYVDSERPETLVDTTKNQETIKSIQYYRDGIGEFMSVNPKAIEEAIREDQPIGNLVSIPNFALEMRESSIFIEAEKIVIDGETYVV